MLFYETYSNNKVINHRIESFDELVIIDAMTESENRFRH